MSTVSLKNSDPLVSMPAGLLDHHPLPSWILSLPSLQVIYANNAAVFSTGYTIPEQCNLSFENLFTDGCKVDILEKASTNQQLKGTYFLLPKHGNTSQIELFDNTFLWKDSLLCQVTAAPSGADVISNDNSLFQKLIEQTSDILTASDLKYRPITWNKAAEKVFGITAQEAIGTDMRTFFDVQYPGFTKEEVRDIISNKGEWKGEANFIRLNGAKQVTVLITFKLLRNEKDTPVGILISGTDITDRKNAELILKESENRFREMADSAPVMIWMSDTENKITYVNKTWVRSTGMDLAKTKNVGWVDLIHPDDVLQAKKKFDNHFNSHMPVNLIYRMKLNGDQYRWVQETGMPRILKDGTFVGFIGSVVDINSQKIKEEQLRYHSYILENVSDIIVTADNDFRIKTWNKAAEEYFGIAEKDAIGKNKNEVLKVTYHNGTENQMLEELKRTGVWMGEKSFVDSRGEVKYYLQSIKYVYEGNSKNGIILSVGRDITDRKKSEEKILNSEQFYRTLIADSSNGTLLSDANGTITFTSQSVKYILGWEEKDILGHNLFEFVHPEDQSWAYESFQKELVERPEVKSIVVRLGKKNGEWLWCMVRGHNLLSNPYIKSFVVYFHDDTLRKKANDALKESEKRFRNLILEIQMGIVIQDKNGRVILCNNAFAKMVKMHADEVIGKNIYDISTDAIKEDGTKYALQDRPGNRSVQSKKTIRDAVLGLYIPSSKERVWVIINSDPVLDDNGEVIHIISSVKDITERKRMEEEMMTKQISHQRQLTQATIDGQEKERTEIGKELHDNIGQQLTTIKLFLDLAKGTADDNTVEMVNMALKGVSDVINDIRSMSRSLVPSTLKDLGLLESINELTEPIAQSQLLKIHFNHKGFHENRIPENQKLTIFRILQEQMNNIVKHAKAKNCWISLKSSSKETVLEIKDDGKGFDKNKIKKGLGFVNIRNRAELFGGYAEIISKTGKGTQVTVWLPKS
ncbi:MAG: PAS domain S-box protein [Flavisolibacter sp.]